MGEHGAGKSVKTQKRVEHMREEFKICVTVKKVIVLGNFGNWNENFVDNMDF